MKCEAETMNNGEQRFRLISDDGSGYIRTEAGESGGWQNSHFHHEFEETTIVQKGWIALAELTNDEMTLTVMHENNIYTSRAKVSHNLYLPAGAIIHTVKHGNVQINDWHSCNKLDKLTKKLGEEQIAVLANEAK